ncbi:hypothetical protein D3C77_612230 [compost metagenome]
MVGAGHPVDEPAHHQHTDQHGQVGQHRQGQGAGFGQPHRRGVAVGPADPGGADEGGNGRDGRQDEQGIQPWMAGLLLAADLAPFAVGMGEQPPDMIDHGLHLLVSGSSPVAVRQRATLCRSIGVLAKRLPGRPLIRISGNGARGFPWRR